MNSLYNRALCIFSPEGHLLQVEYASEAVRMAATTVALRTMNFVIMGVEKKSYTVLQVESADKKICKLDDHIMLAFAGLTADARALINRARFECSSHKINLNEWTPVGHITQYIGRIKQYYTQSQGRRPFGVAYLIGGFNSDGTSHLYETHPSGVWSEMQAAAVGRSGRTAMAYLEKNFNEEKLKTEEDGVKLIIKTLCEIARPGQKFFHIVVMRKPAKPKEAPIIAELEPNKIEHYINDIVREARKRKKEC